MKKPDELIANIDRSIFAKALVMSVIAHAALMGATSVSLFQDWMRYGFHSPSYINAEKTRERREAEETRRREATAEKAKSEAAEAEAKKAAPGQTDQAAPAAEPAKQTVAVEEAAAAEEKEKKTPPEVEPLPPKKEFQYGDDLTLD
ncbi:MAG: hypothetical protein J6Q49_09155 [Kiritimatiellae bacterium]|jgi:hypothetical protein|nr:hypothetical protein [Kiritimatiellia bacterium]